jgi:hypothetical protein
MFCVYLLYLVRFLQFFQKKMYLHVPVSSAVKKFLLKEYAGLIEVDAQGRPVLKLNRHEVLGDYVVSLLANTGKPTGKIKVWSVGNHQKQTEENIIFKVSKKYQKYSIPEENAQKFVYYLDKLFKTQIIQKIANLNAIGFSISDAIRYYYAYYEITEEDYSEDNMRRYFDRYAEKILHQPLQKYCNSVKKKLQEFYLKTPGAQLFLQF